MSSRLARYRVECCRSWTILSSTIDTCSMKCSWWVSCLWRNKKCFCSLFFMIAKAVSAEFSQLVCGGKNSGEKYCNRWVLYPALLPQ